jgi:hypothetical protein
MLSNQEIFDRVCNYADEMNQLSFSLDKDPAYRTHDGRACLIGSFIPEPLYYISLERKSVLDLLGFDTLRTDEVVDIGRAMNLFQEIGLIDLNLSIGEFASRGYFLSALQDCHDSACSVEDMYMMLCGFSNDYDLVVNNERVRSFMPCDYRVQSYD